jgi:hypothetical protein
MFNRCRRWRAMLARRADSALSATQWGALQDHLASCDHCRLLAQADDSLHEVLGMHSALLRPDAARAFDDRVIATLTMTRPMPTLSLRARWSLKWNVQWRALPLDFLAQIGGGAVLAVCLTSFFLIPALHSGTPGKARLISDKLARENLERAEAPVSMESLLNTRAPRAAMLWTAPGEHKVRRALTTPFGRPRASFHMKTEPAHVSPAHEGPEKRSDLPREAVG